MIIKVRQNDILISIKDNIISLKEDEIPQVFCQLANIMDTNFVESDIFLNNIAYTLTVQQQTKLYAATDSYINRFFWEDDFQTM